MKKIIYIFLFILPLIVLSCYGNEKQISKYERVEYVVDYLKSLDEENRTKYGSGSPMGFLYLKSSFWLTPDQINIYEKDKNFEDFYSFESNPICIMNDYLYDQYQIPCWAITFESNWIFQKPKIVEINKDANTFVMCLTMSPSFRNENCISIEDVIK